MKQTKLVIPERARKIKTEKEWCQDVSIDKTVITNESGFELVPIFR